MTRALTSALSTAIVQPELRTALLFEGQFGGQTLRLWNGTCDIIWADKENLVQRSNTFSSAYWAKARLHATTPVIANAIANPIDGTVNAWRVVEDNTTNTHLIYSSSLGTLQASTRYRYEIYAKTNGRHLALRFDSSGTSWVGGTPYAQYDLTNGLVAASGSGVTASIRAAGNGWFHLIADIVSAASLTGSPYYDLYLQSTPTTTSYAGDNSSGVYLYNAQARRPDASLDAIVLTDSAQVIATRTPTMWLGNGWLYIPEPPDEGDDMAAAQMMIVLAGVPQEVVSLALQPSGTAAMQQNSTGTLYFAALDSNGALIADPYKLFVGKLDVPTIDERVGGSLVSLTYESVLVELDRAKEYRFNQETQKIFYPSDRGFEYVNAAKNWDGFWGNTKKEIAKKAAVNKGGAVKSNRATGNKGTRKK